MALETSFTTTAVECLRSGFRECRMVLLCWPSKGPSTCDCGGGGEDNPAAHYLLRCVRMDVLISRSVLVSVVESLVSGLLNKTKVERLRDGL